MTTTTGQQTTTTNQQIEHEIGLTGELVLKLVEGDVRIRAIDGPRARVVIDAPGLEDRIGIDRLPGALRVCVPDRFMSVGWLGFDLRSLTSPRGSVRMDVEVPRAANVVIDGASTRVQADGLVGGQRIHLVSGDVRLDGGGGDIRIDGVSGRVAIDALAPVAVAVRTVSGDVAVRAPSIAELRVSSMSSRVDAAGAFIGDGPFRIETVSGRSVILTDSPLRVESHTVTGGVLSERAPDGQVFDNGRTFVFGQGGPTLSFNSMSGSLRVRPLGGRFDGTGAAAATPAGGSQPSGAPSAPSGPATAGPGSAATVGTDAVSSSGEPTTATESIPVMPAERTGDWNGSQLAAQPAASASSSAAPLATEAARSTGDASGDQDRSTGAGPRDRRIAVLRALERGEIDVDEASRRLESLDADRPWAGDRIR